MTEARPAAMDALVFACWNLDGSATFFQILLLFLSQRQSAQGIVEMERYREMSSVIMGRLETGWDVN